MKTAFVTPRLAIPGGVLRPWERADSDRLVAAWNDADIAAWNPVPAEPSVEIARRWIEGVAERETSRTSIDWVIDVSASGGVIGEVGLSGFDPAHDGAMLGYWLLPEGRSQGLASMAVRAVTQWAHDVLNLDVIVARCHPDNPASGAVVARVGYQHERSDSTGHELWISRTRAG